MVLTHSSGVLPFAILDDDVNDVDEVRRCGKHLQHQLFVLRMLVSMEELQVPGP